ncbi:MAG: 4Fe-4S dicluster domain-containing protein [Coriobacteriales bacterium]|jgi:ferredoxin|nr:4Fe-4S dicluster domain-containing protein [Coriobacteriales bacterium]
MSDIQTTLRTRAAELLSSGEVVEVIGWTAGRFDNQTTPAFITKAEDAESLVFNEYCVNTTSKFSLMERGLGKVAVCVRGCDSRGINRMITDNQLKREEVHLIGIPCTGMKDRKTGEELLKCRECSYRNPVVYDELIGESVTEPELNRFDAVEKLEAMDQAERAAFFDSVYERCIRCYACREVCPVCTCKSCFVDQLAAGWQGKRSNVAENKFYGLTRVFHVGDRCVECGECQRACPMDLPLMLLNRKMIKDLDLLFEAGEAGLDAEGTNPLGTYDVNDVEEFM